MLPFFGEQMQSAEEKELCCLSLVCVVGTWRSHFENSNLSHPKPFSFLSRVLCKNVTTKETSIYIYIYVYIYIKFFFENKDTSSQFYTACLVELLNKNNIAYIFTYFFTHIHFKKLQTILFKFLYQTVL